MDSYPKEETDLQDGGRSTTSRYTLCSWYGESVTVTAPADWVRPKAEQIEDEFWADSAALNLETLKATVDGESARAREARTLLRDVRDEIENAGSEGGREGRGRLRAPSKPCRKVELETSRIQLPGE